MTAMPKSRIIALRRAPVSGDQDVLRLHVPVHDPARVRAGERVQHLAHQVQRRCRGERALDGQDVGQVPPRNVLEDGVDDLRGRLARIHQADDVRMTKVGAQLHLALEARDLQLDRVGVGAVVEGQDLHRHVLAGAALDRPVDLRERSRADPVEDVVPLAERAMLEDPGDPIQAHAEPSGSAGDAHRAHRQGCFFIAS
jgi:hypothetical protein